jgi:hypothetical protein
MITTFQAQPHYRVFVLFSLIMVVLFGWDLAHGIEAGSVLFFAISLGLVLWSARAALTKVSLSPQQMTVTAPLSRPKEIEFRQFLSVTEEGRLGKAIVVAYYPRTATGLVDLDRAETVVLPAVSDQDALYEALLQKAPL